MEAMGVSAQVQKGMEDKKKNAGVGGGGEKGGRAIKTELNA